MTDIAGWKLTAQGQHPTLTWDEQGLKGRFIIKADIDMKALDDEKMVVSGFASVEEVDKQGDLITLEAFKKAVKRLEDDGETLSLNYGHTSAKIGTVRKMVFMETTTPRKFWIEAQLKRNSKLAKQCWADVKIGKLKAFSIGGMALVPGIRWCESTGKCVNKIDDIELYEVSMVEEPANQKSLVMAIKSAFPEFTRTNYTKEDGKIQVTDENKPEPLENRVVELEDITRNLVMVVRGSLLGKEYADFAECVADNGDKEDPEGFCAYLGNKGTMNGALEALDKACSGRSKFPNFGRKKKGDTMKKQDKPAETEQGVPQAPPVNDELEKLKTQIAALEADAKLQRMEREKAEKALAEATKAKEIPTPPPAPQPAPVPAPEVKVGQPPSKGEHPNATPQASGSQTLAELAHKLNEERKPLSWGMKTE